LNKDNAFSLYECSDIFQVKSLQQGISKYLELTIQNYTLKEIFRVFTLSDKLNHQNLKNLCIKLIRNQKNISILTSEWKNILSYKPELVTEIMDF
jgi:hypothetical protein